MKGNHDRGYAELGRQATEVNSNSIWAPGCKVDTFDVDEEHLCGRYVLLEKIGGGNYGIVAKMKDVDARRQSQLQSQAIEHSRGIITLQSRSMAEQATNGRPYGNRAFSGTS